MFIVLWIHGSTYSYVSKISMTSKNWGRTIVVCRKIFDDWAYRNVIVWIKIKNTIELLIDFMHPGVIVVILGIGKFIFLQVETCIKSCILTIYSYGSINLLSSPSWMWNIIVWADAVKYRCVMQVASDSKDDSVL